MKSKTPISKTSKLKKSTIKKFNNELKKSMNTAIVAAFGLLIALVWKDVITEYVDALTAMSPVQGKLVSAVIVTLVGVAGILIVTRVLRIEE